MLAGGDVGLAGDEGAIVHAGGEGDVGVGCRVDAASGGEDLRGHLDGLGEVTRDVREGGDEEVAEAVALKFTLTEAELEEFREQVLVFGEGDHAVADIAGGKHFEVFAETTGGASVVGDGDDGGEVADKAGKVGAGWIDCGLSGVGSGDVAFETAEEGGEAGTSPYGDYAEAKVRSSPPFPDGCAFGTTRAGPFQ